MAFHLYTTPRKFDFETSIAISNESGKALKNTIEVRKDDNQYDSVVMICCNGNLATGVVVSKREEPIKINRKSFSSIILTIGHSIGRRFTQDISDFDYIYITTSRGIFEGVVLADLSNIEGQSLIDPVSELPYVIPDDL